MKEYSEEELIGMCEAYQFYSILPEDEQKKIPEKFVKELEECSQFKKGAIINGVSDIKAEKLSKAGIAKMAYMCLFLK